MLEELRALELIYAPDEYLCTWRVPDGEGGWRSLPGSVDVRADRVPRGMLYGDLPLDDSSTISGQAHFAFPQRVREDVLLATLANGGMLILLDAEIVYEMLGSGYVSGSAALLGKTGVFYRGISEEDGRLSAFAAPRVVGARIQVSALDAVCGTTPLGQVAIPKAGDPDRREWIAQANPDAALEWQSGGTTLSVGFDGRARVLDGYEFSIRFSPVATLKLEEPLPLHSVVEDFVEPLRKIIAIATAEPRDLTYLAVQIEGASGWFQVYGTGIAQSPYVSSGRAQNSLATAIRSGQDGVSLLELVEAWQALERAHDPLVETYGSMIYAKEQHPRSRFLLLIQAIEGIYGQQTREQYDKRQSTLTEARASVLMRLGDLVGSKDGDAGVTGSALSADEFKFLKRHLMKKPMGGLDQALRVIVSQLPHDVMAALADTSLIKGVFDAVETEAPERALREVRNSLAHGVRGYPPEQLLEVVAILEEIVRGHALRLLGCPDSVVARVFNERKGS